MHLNDRGCGPQRAVVCLVRDGVRDEAPDSAWCSVFTGVCPGGCYTLIEKDWASPVPLDPPVRLPWWKGETHQNMNCLSAAELRRKGKDMKMKRAFAAICLSFLLTTSAFGASTKEDLQARIDASKVVLDQIMQAGDRTVPSNILKSATCVAVVPSMVKGAFFVGAQYGQGVVVCRTGHGWSAPVFIRMAGGSFGFQWGGQATDLILIAVNDRGMQDLLKDKFKIGGDASAAAGPVGRSGTASTDWKMSAELLSYSRTKGIFAGIDLDGTSVRQNIDDTNTYYGSPHHFEAILRGDVAVPPGAVPFVRDVASYFVKAKAGSN